MPENIAITGLGAISACGNNAEESLESFALGRRNAGKVTLFKTELPYSVFEVKNFLGKDTAAMRTLNLAFQALEEAIRDANLEDLSEYRVGICLGTTVASQLNDMDFYKSYREKGSAPLDAASVF